MSYNPSEQGCRFERFPAVLQLQLKRFEFDLETMRMCKINSYFAFDTELDLAPFITKGGKTDAATGTEVEPELMYHLYGVLVHSGSVHGGHYYSYIRPIPVDGEDYQKSPWYKFDDETVLYYTSRNDPVMTP